MHREGCTEQSRNKCSPGVSDTLAVHVRRPVGVYERGVLQRELCKGVVDVCSISINSNKFGIRNLNQLNLETTNNLRTEGHGCHFNWDERGVGHGP